MNVISNKYFRWIDEIPDGLKLLFLTLLVGHGGEGTLIPFDRSGGCRLFLLQRVKLINGFSLHRRSTVVVTNPVLFFLRLNLRQSVLLRISEAEISVTVPVRSHLLLRIRFPAKFQNSVSWTCQTEHKNKKLRNTRMKRGKDLDERIMRKVTNPKR